jgi:transcriptional regulator with XRE-family HTH domain
MGAWLREARLKAELTQDQLASLLGVKGGTSISAIENGRNAIGPERYEALAKILGVDKAAMGKVFCRWTNPWLYALIYGSREQSLREDLANIPERGRSKT